MPADQSTRVGHARRNDETLLGPAQRRIAQPKREKLLARYSIDEFHPKILLGRSSGEFTLALVRQLFTKSPFLERKKSTRFEKSEYQQIEYIQQPHS